jgi:hypothetical protein
MSICSTCSPWITKNLQQNWIPNRSAGIFSVSPGDVPEISNENISSSFSYFTPPLAPQIAALISDHGALRFFSEPALLLTIFTLLFRTGFCVFRICPGEHQSPSSCGAAPPLLAEMLAPRAFAAGAGDTGESCASSRLSLRSLRAASLHGLPAPCGTLNHSDPSACLLLHRIDLELTPCKKLPGRATAAAIVLAATYLNMKGSSIST